MCCGEMRTRPVMKKNFATEPKIDQTNGVEFEYIGRTALSVLGAVSKITYRFDRPGARTMVDPRDRLSVAGVPVLKQVAR